jgi:hypothetical protein
MQETVDLTFDLSIAPECLKANQDVGVIKSYSSHEAANSEFRKLQSRKQTLRRAQAASAAGKTDRGLPDGDHPIGRVPTAEVRVGAESPGTGGSNKEPDAQVDRQAELVQLGSSIENFCRRIHAGLINADVAVRSVNSTRMRPPPASRTTTSNE